MRSLLLFVAFVVLAALTNAAPLPDGARDDVVVHYAGHKVITFTPQTEADIALIKKHLQQQDLTLREWTRVLKPGVAIDIQFSPSDLIKAASSLLDKVAYIVKIEDLAPLVDADYEHAAEVDRMALHKRQANIFTAYQPTATLISYLAGRGGTLFNLGTSFQGTTIQGVRIGTGSRPVVIHGGIHAREWISPAVVTFIADQLITNSSFSDLRADFTFYVIPVLNVDGYAFTRSNDRLWRKNRQTNPGSTCIGIDLNRNFGFQWGGASTSTNPCDNQVYRGRSAFEATETRLISNFITSLGGVVSYIDFHAYSQLWMFPYGYSCSVTSPDQTAQRAGGAAAVAALRATNGVSFTNQRTCQLYAASGVSNDWAYGSARVKYAYAVELRDTGSSGFLLPASQILPSGRETTAAVAALWRYVRANP